MKSKVEQAITQKSIYLWANRHRKIKSEGSWQDYNLKSHPYLLKPLQSLQDPDTEQLVVMAGTQTGKTEAMLSALLFYMANRGQNALLTLPHQSALTDFAHSRLDPLIENSPFLRNYFSDISNVRLKTSNHGGNMYLRGAAGSEAQMEEFNVGAVLFDEVSRFEDQAVVDLALKRLGSTKKSNQYVIYCGHPLYEGCRVSEEYSNSSRYEWAYKCPNCGGINVPVDFFKNYYDRDRTLGCRSCSEDWTKEDVLQGGFWKAQGDSGNPNQGFHLSRMLAPTQDLDKMADSLEKAQSEGGTNLATWHQTYLGRPFSASGDQLSEKQIKSLMTGPSMATAQAEGTCLGVDTGQPIYYTVLSGNQVLSLGKCSSFSQLAEVKSRYDSKIIGIDASPEYHRAKEFIESLGSGSKGILIRTKGTGRVEEPKVKPDQNEVTVHGTYMFDLLFQKVNKGELTFPGDMPAEAVEHFTNPVRIIDDNEVSYQKGTCHWADSTKFGILAQNVQGEFSSIQNFQVFSNAELEGMFNENS